MKAFLGLDPGKSGAIAVLCPDLNFQQSHKMPDTEADIWELIHELSYMGDGNVCAAIEVVHSMPGQGVSSCFTFGKGYGGLRMALIAAKIPFRDVRPQVWQKHHGCLTKGEKNISKSKAQQLFPHLKVTHATADSLLIAQWNLETSV